MKVLVFLTILLLCGKGAFAGPKPLFVSLGAWCHTATALKQMGLRDAAYPFDWLASPSHDSLIELLNDDFQFFTDEEHFTQTTGYEHSFNTLKHTRYNLLFHHDTPARYEKDDLESYQNHLATIKARYQRRIQRFRELRNYTGKVFFIRNPTWKEGADGQRNADYAKELKEALDRYFPSLDFTLVIVNSTYESVSEIEGIEGVAHYKIDDVAALIRALNTSWTLCEIN